MTNIQWYPGHMAKAKRELTEKLPLVDVVFELVDARVPVSSRNPDVVQLIQNKPQVLILMKSDLADPKVTNQWLNYYKQQNIKAVPFNGKSNQGIDKIIEAARSVLEENALKREEKGLKERAIRAVTVGIPNVGKSTLINRFAGKNITTTGNRPGVTKAQQWIKYKNQLELLDMPGILWPKFEEPLIGQKLALTGAIKETLYYKDDIAIFGINYLTKNYPGVLAKRYNFDLMLEEELSAPDLLLLITEKRGYFDDYDRGADMLLNELRDGKLGRLSFETLEDMNINENDNK
ncbi:ribosome biogenesis GTPase A [Atopostipes suicloacalis DSM 15692]|uniref:Ribosome biogenesis GTPase A n=1 Tax=Atopostipes suicloacalis DSM 15692 TaxID=1121025 RepID=A0A1M4WG45_9LACT|nr:ribosome biogenesis GTPase YlqF [Atopostipes suicloacalis]SHE80157.1 ribosome biogenesis GTPase A [Atopostipes suicloacalis DSM 15692]